MKFISIKIIHEYKCESYLQNECLSSEYFMEVAIKLKSRCELRSTSLVGTIQLNSSERLQFGMKKSTRFEIWKSRQQYGKRTILKDIILVDITPNKHVDGYSSTSETSGTSPP